MLVVDNFHLKFRYTYSYRHFFHTFSKVLLGFHAIKLFECQKNTFGIRNTQYSIALSVHQQPCVFNTTYTIQSRSTQRCSLRFQHLQISLCDIEIYISYFLHFILYAMVAYYFFPPKCEILYSILFCYLFYIAILVARTHDKSSKKKKKKYIYI